MKARCPSVYGRTTVRHVLPMLALVALTLAPVSIRAESLGHGSMMQGQGSVPAMQHSASEGALGTMAGSAQSSPATSAYQAVVMKMHEGQLIGFTGDADRDFASHMIRHHQGAIDMAQVELQYGRDPQIRELASKIIADQQREIAIMRKWLKTHPQMPSK
jgi:hypothetical protein